MNTALKSREDINRAIEQVNKLGLPQMKDPSKNWDSLAALDLILINKNKNEHIFDAGGALYSVILPWLFLYGYRNLIAGNLVFNKPIKKGPIIYKYCDITNTDFNDDSFDIITCLSVIEHGVNLQAYFREMSRLLKPGGILITSTDYYETPVDTKNQQAYGVPIHVFNKDEITSAIKLAAQFGLTSIKSIDLNVNEKVVKWERFNLEFTSIVFSLYKGPL
jgi:SAM-dependent methyltransferase